MFEEVVSTSPKKPALQPQAEQATGERCGLCSWTRRQLHPMTLCRRLRFSKPPWPYLEDHCDGLGSCSHEDRRQRALGKITGHWAEGTRGGHAVCHRRVPCISAEGVHIALRLN